MMKRLILCLVLIGTAYAVEPAVPQLQLDKNAINVAVEGKRPPLLACTARLVYPSSDGTTGVSADSYLIQYDYGTPTIADRIDGFAVHLEMRDINGDGQKELVALFHTGANAYGVKVYRVTKARYRPVIYPLSDQPKASNMNSIQFVDSEIRVLVQTMLDNGKAEQETMRYKLDGDRIKLVGSIKKIVP